MQQSGDREGYDPTLAQSGEDRVEEGVALSLSGGGYRAMLYHLGVLSCLNDRGRLSTLARVSSVSGGSIVAAALGIAWKKLAFDAKTRVATNLREEVAAPVHALADRTIQWSAIGIGMLTPGVTIAERVAAAYRKHLFGDATLQDLPADGEGPRFVINATNVQTGSLFRFSRPYLADYRLGRVLSPSVPLADAVAASSAFPPFLSPFDLRLDDATWVGGEGDPALAAWRRNVVLTDGGVYDNLGLETTFKRYRTLLVSDGGQKTPPELNPARDWAQHAYRVLQLVDDQVRSLRKRQLLGAYESGLRNGAYFGIRTTITDYPKPGPITVDPARARELADTPTGLAELERDHQERIVNLGYAMCDAALRSFVESDSPDPIVLPYPDRGI